MKLKPEQLAEIRERLLHIASFIKRGLIRGVYNCTKELHTISENLNDHITALDTKLEAAEDALGIAILAKQDAERQASAAHQKTYKEALLSKQEQES